MLYPNIPKNSGRYPWKKNENRMRYSIDRQAAIDCVTYDVEHTIECLKALPSAQPEPHWIPCSERLPDVGSGIIFCDVDGDIFVGHRASEHWWSVDDKVKNVVAWMPLPEPYKGGEKG